MKRTDRRGPIAWMVRNPVAANLAAAVLIIGGLMTAFRIKKEVFPEFELDAVRITVPYPSASPEEVERGILLAVEEEVRSLDAVKRVTSSAFEGSGVVLAELRFAADRDKSLQEIKNAVDRITSFPREAERPVIQLLSNRRHVISLVLYGDVDTRTLHSVGEVAREELLRDAKITLVTVEGVPRPEIHVEIPQANLRKYHLTCGEVARTIRAAAVDLPAGGVKTDGGEILLRTDERRSTGAEFHDIPILSGADGTDVRLEDIAKITDGFEDTEEEARFNGLPAVAVKVFRVGDQTPLEIAEHVKEHAKRLETLLPPGIGVTTWQDSSLLYRQRVALLTRNAQIGLLLVIIILGLFLEVRIAFWVLWGIPTALLGALLFMPLMGVSINMISLFAFVMALGIVVDDAIVVGENIHELRRKGVPFARAAILGTRQVAVPVVFSVLTNIAAFLPMFIVPGVAGKFFRTIPCVIVAVFSITIAEAIFIFPAHLAHQRPARKGSLLHWFSGHKSRLAGALERAAQLAYARIILPCLEYRYLTLAVAVALLILTAGYVAGGRIKINFLARSEFDTVVASVVMPYGTPVAETRAVRSRLVESARRALAEQREKKICKGIFTRIGSPYDMNGFIPSALSASGGHLATIEVGLVPSDQRNLSIAEFTRRWRKRVGEIVGVESVTFEYDIGPSGGKPIDIELSGPDRATMESAAAELATELRSFDGVKDVDDGFARGKPQLSFKITPEAAGLGLTAKSLGSQVRDAFHGAEALREQRGRDEIKVKVMLPEDERTSEYHVETLMIRTPVGGEMALPGAATVTRGDAFTEISREDGRRVIHVTANLEPAVTNAETVLAELEADRLPQLTGRYPGLRYAFVGEQRELRESLRSLAYGGVLAALLIYAMLAIPLKSYLQGFIIIVAVPFGAVGAVVGHVIMGYDLSLVSILGIVALAGVVVNDALVLVHALNERRAGGLPLLTAVAGAGKRRLRPILLTSLTTFFGLAPLVFETSVQGQTIIPMAISMAYGILFATAISLILIPALYLILEDIKALCAAPVTHPAKNRNRSAIRPA